MTHRAWVLVSAGYALLAIGLVVSLFVNGRQQDRLDDQQRDLRNATQALCRAVSAPEADEVTVLGRLIGGLPAQQSALCERIH